MLNRRIDGEISSLVGVVEKISRGEFDVEAKTSGELAVLGTAPSIKWREGLKEYMARLEGDAVLRGGSGNGDGLPGGGQSAIWFLQMCLRKRDTRFRPSTGRRI